MIYNYKNTSGIKEQDITKYMSILKEYGDYINTIVLQKEYTVHESCLNLIYDNKFIDQINLIKKQILTGKEKYIFVVGIGGSNLGPKSIYDAIIGYYDQNIDQTYPKIIWLDTVNPNFIEVLFNKIENLSKEEYIINVITKSGSTTETIYNIEILLTKLSKERLVVTTDTNSKLHNIANQNNIPVLEIPTQVGGRYSVFSAVGLFSLSLVGINIQGLVEGAKNALEKHNENAMYSAIALYINYLNTKIINDNFIFNPELENLGKWYRQLMAESLGKDEKGILPTVSIGSVDLHSTVQLYLGGQDNIYTTFVKANYKNIDVKIGNEFGVLINNIQNKKPLEIIESIYNGVKRAYTKKQRTYNEIILEHIDEYSIGTYMQFKMLEIMYLGKLFNVNAFNQPNVEDYKEETRQILAQ